MRIHEHAHFAHGKPWLLETQPLNSQGVRWDQKRHLCPESWWLKSSSRWGPILQGQGERLSLVTHGVLRHGAGTYVWKQTPQLSTALDEPESGLGTLTWLIQEVLFYSSIIKKWETSGIFWQRKEHFEITSWLSYYNPVISTLNIQVYLLSVFALGVCKFLSGLGSSCLHQPSSSWVPLEN